MRGLLFLAGTAALLSFGAPAYAQVHCIDVTSADVVSGQSFRAARHHGQLGRVKQTRGPGFSVTIDTTPENGPAEIADIDVVPKNGTDQVTWPNNPCRPGKCSVKNFHGKDTFTVTGSNFHIKAKPH